MKDRKHNPPGKPAEEVKLPACDPAPARPLDEPDPKRKNTVTNEEDDATGEMASAGQDLGLVVEERDTTSVEHSGATDEEDQDDATDKGRG